MRKHEAGDSVSYTTFGKLIFRQIDGQCSGYNRVDKISMNDPSQVDPKQAYRTFSAPQTDEDKMVPRRKKKVTDGMQMEDELRNCTGVY